MKRFAVLILVLALGGCSTPVSRLVGRDLDSAVVMAKVAGTEQEAACFEVLRGVMVKLEEIEALDSDGIIATVYKTWLVRHYRDRAIEGLAKGCLPVIAGMGAHMLMR